MTTMTKEELLQAAKSLPKDQRIDLIMDLWASIEIEADDFPLTAEQKQELDRRIAADNADASPGEEWEVLKATLLSGQF